MLRRVELLQRMQFPFIKTHHPLFRAWYAHNNGRQDIIHGAQFRQFFWGFVTHMDTGKVRLGVGSPVVTPSDSSQEEDDISQRKSNNGGFWMS